MVRAVVAVIVAVLAASSGASAVASPSPTARCAPVTASAVSRVMHRKVVFVPYKGLLQNAGNGSVYSTQPTEPGIGPEAWLSCVYEGFPPFVDVILTFQHLSKPAAPLFTQLVAQTTYDRAYRRTFHGLGFPGFEEIGLSTFYYPLAGSPIKTDTSVLLAATRDDLLEVSIIHAIPVTSAQLSADTTELGPLMKLTLSLNP